MAGFSNPVKDYVLESCSNIIFPLLLFRNFFYFQIVVGGPAACTGKLEMGDKILSVNGIDVRGKGRQVG